MATTTMGNSDHTSTEAPPRLSLVTLGKPTLILDGSEVQLSSRKAIALLAYLSTKDNHSESREILAGLLWGDSSEEKARASLRQTLSKYREHFGEAFVRSDRLDVTIPPGSLSADYLALFDDLGDGRVHRKFLETKRISDTFLYGFDDLDSGFRNWLQVFRQTLEDKFRRTLEGLLGASTDHVITLDVANALINLDPTHEPACRAAMKAYAQRKITTSALRVYNNLWELLGREYDAEPSAETQDLVAKIKLGESFESPSIAVQIAPIPNSIGQLGKSRLGHTLIVHQFDTFDVPRDRASVVRIFRTELVAALTRFRDWSVFEDTQVSLSNVAGTHRVEAIAYEESRSLRFVLTLREAETGKFVWSERFSLGIDAWFDTMQTVIRRIAVALEVNISTDRLERVAGRPELSLELFDRWLRAQQSIFRWKPAEEAVADSLFRSIIREAPEFAPAYAGMAGILNVRHLIFPGKFRSDESQKEALSFASRAVEIDPLDSRTQLHLAWSFAMSGEFQKAAITFRLAIELNRDDPWTMVSSAEGLALCGNVREALALVRLAEETGLMYSELQWSYQTVICFAAQDFAGCVEAASRADAALNCCGAWSAAALGLLGRLSEAATLAQQFITRIRQLWTSGEEPTDREVVRWLLLGFPIASQQMHLDFLQGLRNAGLPLDSHESLLTSVERHSG